MLPNVLNRSENGSYSVEDETVTHLPLYKRRNEETNYIWLTTTTNNSSGTQGACLKSQKPRCCRHRCSCLFLSTETGIIQGPTLRIMAGSNWSLIIAQKKPKSLLWATRSSFLLPWRSRSRKQQLHQTPCPRSRALCAPHKLELCVTSVPGHPAQDAMRVPLTANGKKTTIQHKQRSCCAEKNWMVCGDSHQKQPTFGERWKKTTSVKNVVYKTIHFTSACIVSVLFSKAWLPCQLKNPYLCGVISCPAQSSSITRYFVKLFV